MARRPNYGFEKRQKELEKQKKKDEKAEKKRLRKEAGTDEYGNSLYVEEGDAVEEGEDETEGEGEEGAEGGDRDDDKAAG